MRKNTARLRQVVIPGAKKKSPGKNGQGARVTRNTDVALIIDIENDCLFLMGKMSGWERILLLTWEFSAEL